MEKEEEYDIYWCDKQGVVDYKGENVISLKWDYCLPLYNGTTIVKFNEKYSIVENYTEKEILSFPYTEVRPFLYTSDRYPLRESYPLRSFFKVKLDGKWGIIDKNGREITPMKYCNVINPYQEKIRVSTYPIVQTENSKTLDYIVVELNEKRGIIDTAGNEILPIIYDKCLPITENLTLVVLDDKKNLIKTDTKEKILLIECEDINRFDIYPQHIFISCDDRLYYIDKTSEKLLACVPFDDYLFIGNHIAVERNSRWGYFNYDTGKEIIPCEYDNLSQLRNKLKKIIKKQRQ